MEPLYEITRTVLIAALTKWDEDAAANQWPERTDAERHADNADYLLGLMSE